MLPRVITDAHKFYNSFFFLKKMLITLKCDVLINKHSGQFQEGKLKIRRWIDRILYVVIVEKIKIHLHKTLSVVSIIEYMFIKVTNIRPTTPSLP